MTTYYAHSGDDAVRFSDFQLLADHLRGVATGARERAEAACSGSTALAAAAYAAGLLHDLGKYRPEFQSHVRGLRVQREKTWHKQAGAAWAYDKRYPPVCFAIAGHHGGMPDRGDLKALVDGDAGRAVAGAVWPAATADCPELSSASTDPPSLPDNLAGELFTRVVFSCLVDADWADAGEFERRRKGLPADPPAPALDAAGWLARVLAFIERRAAVCDAPAVAAARADVLAACLTAAGGPTGLYKLTVPTGGGKTLAALAFALKHAAARGLRRVVYVAPYLSILDQNARVIREALGLGPDAAGVFEHHSLSDPPGDGDADETRRDAAARRAENWDAPVVVTTSVQFFESLFSNKPGRCRKLHNVARGVVVLDECQTLPPGLVAPTCGMLKQLAERLGCTVVLCTATQPAFDHADLGAASLKDAREIAGPELDLFARLRRVGVEWPRPGVALDWPAVADRMAAGSAALCVVNTRRAARELFAELKRTGRAGVFHLSTGMCPAHRLAVLDEVKRRLRAGGPCYLASTQLIEAGVDVDFPVVLRELSPLEAIIQAAGRCNREGRLPDGGGRVIVFRGVEGRLPPDRWYSAGRLVLETSFLNAGREPRIDDPADVREYFTRLYRTGDLDKHGIQSLRGRCDFRTIAKAYRLIDDDGEAVVVASWEERRGEVEALLESVRRRPTRSAYRKLAPFQVNLRRYELAKVGGSVCEEAPGVSVWRGGYDPDLGLAAEGADALLMV